MARYKLANALWSTEPEEHDTDEAAWNSLRKIFNSSRFTWMWKEVEVEVPINNEENYVKLYNEKYGPKPIGYGPDDARLMKVGEKNIETVWIPVLAGITTDEYKVNKQNNI